MFLFFTIIPSKKFLFYGLFILLSLFPALALADEVEILSIDNTFESGQTFTVSVQVIVTENTVNAINASLKFDPTILSVVSISKDSSVFTRWTTLPTYSNSLGTIEFGGISDTPLSGLTNLVEVTFLSLAPWDGELIVSDLAVFATDGLRTNVSADTTLTALVLDLDVSSITTDSDDVPEVHSKIYTDEEIWYDVATGTFAWEIPTDTEAVAVEITNTPYNRPNNNPEAIYESPITEYIITSDVVTDGVQYLSLRFRDENGWGDILYHKLLIDITPPEPFPIQIHSDGTDMFPTLYFNAIDFTSGVAGYDIKIADHEAVVVPANEVEFGYQLNGLEDGIYEVAITAFDRAGNSRISRVEVPIAAGYVVQDDRQHTKSMGVFTDIPNFSVYILVVIIIFLLLHTYFERKQITLKENKLSKETHEIQEQMEKIFSALRDEIYDQINTLSKRKRLSKTEKEVIEGLNQAIEVSETLIEKEIDDVKMILK